MKKILFLAFLIIISTFTFGCKNTKINTAFDKPPILKVANGQSEAEAVRYGYTWERKDANGKSLVEIADSANPLDDVNALPIISILPAYVSTINPMNAYLMFDIAPDSVTAKCWDTKLFNEDTAEIEILDAHLEDGTYFPDIILKLKNMNCIYEITAEWTSYEEFGGKASYCFRTDGEIIYENNAVVIR